MVIIASTTLSPVATMATALGGATSNMDMFHLQEMRGRGGGRFLITLTGVNPAIHQSAAIWPLLAGAEVLDMWPIRITGLVAAMFPLPKCSGVALVLVLEASHIPLLLRDGYMTFSPEG